MNVEIIEALQQYIHQGDTDADLKERLMNKLSMTSEDADSYLAKAHEWPGLPQTAEELDAIDILGDVDRNDILTMQTEAVGFLNAGKSLLETADELVKGWDASQEQMLAIAQQADELRRRLVSEAPVEQVVAVREGFREIALRSAARGEGRVLPIQVGGKNPLIKWADTPIDTATTEEWAGLSQAWIEEHAAKFPNVNAAIIAKPTEHLFIDEDESDRFRKDYEQFSGEPFPKTYTTSARADHRQSHWKQTDRTRKMGNVMQGSTVDGILSVRQNNLYVLAEGSQHKNGVDIYRVFDDSPIVPMPDKLVDYIESIRTDRNKETGDFTKKPEGWLDEPFIHHNINNQLISFAGHYIRANNISDPDELETLLIAKLVKNGCFHTDAKTPFAYNAKEVRKIAEDKVKTWKTGEELRQQGAIAFTSGSVAVYPAGLQNEQYAMTPEQVEAEYEKDFPVIALVEQPGPSWDDDIMYGIAGEIIRKASEYCEAHPAGMYLDLLVAFGNIVGRGPYFNINSTRHYTNEFMARVGLTAESRKGTGRDVIDELLRMVDADWYRGRIMSGFGSSEAIINELRDPMEQRVRDRKSATGFQLIVAPGVADKRLCIREGELASVFQLAGKKESRADIVLRDGWDGQPLRNLVKGKSRDGLSNSAVCMEPHLSISGDTTRAELVAKMPSGAADNGFGNRFLYCYVYRTKKCPNGGPQLNWSDVVLKLYERIQWAKELTYVPLTKSASKLWARMYVALDEPGNKLPGLAGAMTARSAAHIRRLALIYALLDEYDVVENRHLHAAKRMWDYCQESAKFIFTGTTADQDRIIDFVRRNREVTVTQIVQELFQKHKRSTWVETQVNGIIAGTKSIIRHGDKVIAVG